VNGGEQWAAEVELYFLHVALPRAGNRPTTLEARVVSSHDEPYSVGGAIGRKRE
jgi:hypothetical protein